jgi:uncharacterized membrane protein YdbT with pleckstrin-like domain
VGKIIVAIGGFVGLIILPDVLKILWNDIPWWARIVLIVVALIIAIASIRKITKRFRGKGGGRTEIHHYYHY